MLRKFVKMFANCYQNVENIFKLNLALSQQHSSFLIPRLTGLKKNSRRFRDIKFHVLISRRLAKWRTVDYIQHYQFFIALNEYRCLAGYANGISSNISSRRTFLFMTCQYVFLSFYGSKAPNQNTLVMFLKNQRSYTNTFSLQIILKRRLS